MVAIQQKYTVGREYRQLRLWLMLAVAGLVAQLNHVHIPHTQLLLDGRWAFGFMGFALLGNFWAAFLLAAFLSLPWGSEVPFLIGFTGNLAYALPCLALIRTVSRHMERRFGPGLAYSAGWILLVLVCYEAFIHPVAWGISSLINGNGVWAGVLDGWRSRPFMAEAILVALFSAAAMTAAVSHGYVRSARRRLAHINRVLLGIRNVNQLIVNETDPLRLIERVCSTLTETVGYHNAWVALIDENSGKTKEVSCSTDTGASRELMEKITAGEYPYCMKTALETSSTVTVDSPGAQCGSCPTSLSYGNGAGMCRRLEHEGHVFGVLSVSVPVEYVFDPEEQGLFEEVAGDIAFALYRETMRSSLESARRRYQEIFQGSRDGFVMVSGAGKIIDANEAYCKMLGYSLEELKAIADFYAITPERWHDWERREIWEKRLLQDGESGLYEKEYISKDGRVFPVELQSYAVRSPSGKIEYLWGTARDISERKKSQEEVQVQRDRLSFIIAGARLGTWVWNVRDNSAVFNQRWAEMLGYTLEELAPYDYKTWAGLVHPDDLALAEKRLTDCAEGRTLDYDCRFRMKHKDGHWVWVLDRGRVMTRDEDGKPIEMFGTHADITEIIQSEEREALLGGMLNEAPLSITIHSFDDRFLYVNAETARLHGYESESEFMAISLADLDVPESSDKREERYRRISRQGEATFEVRHYRKDGTEFPLEVIAKSITWKGQPAILSMARDISERQEAEAALRESEERFRSLVEFAPVAVLLMRDGRYTYGNPAAADLLGLKNCDEIAGINALDTIAPEFVGAVRDRIGKIDSGSNNAPMEMRIMRPSGEKVWTRSTSVPVVMDGAPAALIVGQDISESKKAEEELQRRENLLERIFTVLPVGMWIADKDGAILRGNPAAAEIWGGMPDLPITSYSMFKGWRLPSGEPLGSDDWALARTLRTGEAILDELIEIESFDGRRKTVIAYTAPVLDDKGNVDGVIIINLDVTERKALEDQLIQAQKMESVGRLAGGVAHDFNNLLMGIMNYVELCREEIADDHPIREWLDDITREAERSASLTRQLLAFARRQVIKPKTMDLNDAVGGILKMLRRLIGENIELDWRPGANLWPVCMDPGQVDQILANLCVNARDAIDGAGTVSIKTSNVTLREDECGAGDGLQPGSYVLLSVKDDGCGMDDATREQVFEPFYTTKEVGRGTGLGLATVYGIVKQNNGFIDVQSEPGSGAAFLIYLPPSSEFSSPASASPARPDAAGGKETVLVVEDEEAVRYTTRLFLDRLGYNVLEAESPQQALALVETSETEIDLLITDMVMPGMGGNELAQKLRADKPGLKVLYMSGYSDDAVTPDRLINLDAPFLQKPFTRDELAAKVRDILQSR